MGTAVNEADINVVLDAEVRTSARATPGEVVLAAKPIKRVAKCGPEGGWIK